MSFLKIEKINWIYIAIIFCLISLPLPFAFGNIALVVLILAIIINYKSLKFNFNIAYLFPIILFAWGAVSVLWSIEPQTSVKAISKNFPLILIPLLFSFLPKITDEKKTYIFKWFSYGISIYMILHLLIAFFRFIKTGETHWFFYHDLVTLKVNAIYASVFVAMAFLFLLQFRNKKILDWFSLILLLISLVLLSSKNILLITLLISILFLLRNYKNLTKRQTVSLSVLGILIFSVFGSFAYKRYADEFRNHKENEILENGIENISLYNAWYQQEFTTNNYFNGSTFRLYQTRVLTEFLEEYPIFWKGFGLNAVQNKLTEKQIDRDLEKYYWNLNFHNQYVQTFAELGFIGFLILLVIAVSSLINAVRNKDFYLLSFAILVVSFFITEAPLSRQRGIMFFILFFCILNQNTKKHKKAI